jgi:hypothetical protein
LSAGKFGINEPDRVAIAAEFIDRESLQDHSSQ